MKITNLLFGVLMLLIFGFSGYGKTKVTTNESNTEYIPKIANLSELERKATLFFESLLSRRERGEKKQNNIISLIKEDEVILAMKVSNRLSPTFQKLYKKATSISDSFNSYISPSGHFEIYYTTSGINGVDTTDNYQYDKKDWRIKVNEPNSVPDYVDECAYALDSCWSMMIGRFGFPPPIPYKDENHPSDLYKVIIELQEETYYGFTYLFEPLPDSIGYRSLLSVRNNWSDPEWSELGYDKNPLNGLRVTCAHEFFHAIQYAMSHQVKMDVFLDDFPLSWTEGTAVCMEELAFDSINDYHQYAITYFNNPSISFLNFPISDIVYTNAILLIYITKHFPSDSKASFIRIMHENNYRERIGFHLNLLNTCEKIYTSWIEILHRFHCNSFFTGNFSDTTRFIPDAPYFKMKTPSIYSLQKPITKRLSPNSAIHIGIIPSQNHSDTLKITFYGDSTATSNELRYSVVQQENDNLTITHVNTDKRAIGSCIIEHWKELKMATLVITNADPLREREVRVEFEIDSIVPNNIVSKDALVYPNPLSKKRDGGMLYVRDSTLKDVYIYSMSGTLIKKKTSKDMSSINKGSFVLDCNDLASGSYLLVISKIKTVKDSINYLKQKFIITP
ncbi:MAG: T9SS type A sorting domain-containing protein [Chitinispirillaceae bacterium]|nr:T9SS type A sorting domain-containing protein [Chitinispirillaceae bacterium]